MSDFSQETVKLLKHTFSLNAALTALIGSNVYWEMAQEGSALPYVLATHYYGGHENNAQTQYTDSVVKIYGVSANIRDAHTIQSEIYNSLHDKNLSLPVGHTYPQSYAKTEQTHPYFFKDFEQNVSIIHAGGFYRIRLILGV